MTRGRKLAKPQDIVKLFNRAVQLRPDLTLTSQNNRSGTKSHYVFLGYDAQGKTVRHSLGTNRQVAEDSLIEIKKRIAGGKLRDASNVFEIANDYEVKACLKRLEGHGVTLTQAVDFFLKHHRPKAGIITVEDAKEIFLKNLERNGRSPAYINAYKQTYLPPFLKTYGEMRLMDLNLQHAEQFIYKQKATLCANSKGEFISKLRTFFNALADLGYSHRELNPFTKLKKPTPKPEDESIEEKDRCVDEVEIMCFTSMLEKEELWDVILYLTLQLFCGVRAGEVHKLDWKLIDIEDSTIEIGKKTAKARRRRLIEIPVNALSWIKLCYLRMDGKWAMRTKNAMRQKLGRIKKSYITEEKKKYAEDALVLHQNFARATFASHAFTHFGKEKTFDMMGHTSDQDLLYTNYREVVSKPDAISYFSIFPITKLDNEWKQMLQKRKRAIRDSMLREPLRI